DQSGNRRPYVRQSQNGRGQSHPRLPQARGALADRARRQAHPRGGWPPNVNVGQSLIPRVRHEPTVVTMTRPIRIGYVAECFWSGVRADDLSELDRRIGACIADDGGSSPFADTPVRYLGSLLIVDDDVVLCLFEGSITTVRRVAERAGVPFQRILRGTGAP